MKEFLKKAYFLLLAGILIFSGVFLQVMPVTHAASAYIDYFQATPIIGSLSSSCWGAAQVGPRDQSNGLEDKTMSTYTYWDGGIIKGTDGLYHMFCSRWSQSLGHAGYKGSVAIHATSSNLYGPYTDKGLCWPDNQSGKGHNVYPFTIGDGYYYICVSDTRPGDIFRASNLNGPWTLLGTYTTSEPTYPIISRRNTSIMKRPDGRFELITGPGVIGVSNSLMGPYTTQGPSIYTNTCGTANMEDPTIWYSGGKYHVVANNYNKRLAYHLTSNDGITGWTLTPGYAYDPTTSMIRYTNGTINHWYKLERPSVYMENGHIVAMTFCVINVEKTYDLGNDQNGSKIIVVPFDGAGLDGGVVSTPTPTRANTPTPTQRVTPTQRGVTPTTTRANTPTPTRGTTPPPGGYVVTYTISSDWGNGGNVDITIKNNTTTAVNGWTLSWTFPGNQIITNMWNAAYTQSGASVSVKDAGYNATIGANGGTTSFGFGMTYSGTNGKPTAFTLNGTACQLQ